MVLVEGLEDGLEAAVEAVEAAEAIEKELCDHF